MRMVSQKQPLSHYRWGNQSDGWNLVDESSLSVKLERMPAGSEELLHYHEHAHQFFFILKGEAVFEIEGTIIRVHEQEGIHIKAKEKHRIMNHFKEDLEFLLCSGPSAQHDRNNII